jgi:hypothetical protein
VEMVPPKVSHYSDFSIDVAAHDFLVPFWNSGLLARFFPSDPSSYAMNDAKV